MKRSGPPRNASRGRALLEPHRRLRPAPPCRPTATRPARHEPPPFIPLKDLGQLVTEDVWIAGRTFHIRKPRSVEDLCRHPALRSAFARDGYLPYWAELWPAAHVLAHHVLSRTWPRAWRTLELGCGLGLTGVAALAAGLDVTLSDVDPTALQLAKLNATHNGFSNAKVMALDLHRPPRRRFDLILAADLLVASEIVEPLVHAVDVLLTPGGTCLLTDQDRDPADLLRGTMSARGLSFTQETLLFETPTGELLGTLYTITHSGGCR